MTMEERTPVSGRLLIGIVRGFAARTIEKLVPVTIRGGIGHLEITMNSPDATTSLRLASELAGGKLSIGAGTVLNEQQLDEALEAGARFIVTPVANPTVIRRCVAQRVPVFPGAFSPGEIAGAWELGATMVKLFPADQAGSGYLRSLKGPLPSIKLPPTGGVTLDTIPEWLAAGADGFGVGGPLFNRARIEAGDWLWLEDRCRQFVTASLQDA
jgi:2-dehydro-3-deoxyphosphogluconate aldolase/(4S)-4-hydroxy-2-oxoglutarate aldolase